MNKLESREKPLVLTIAGSDPTSGAGVQADIRALESTGVYPVSVITALTVQTTEKVVYWEPVDNKLVEKQLFTLLNNYEVKIVKTGMLGAVDTMKIIENAKKEFKFTLIVDPILISGSGDSLSTDEFIKGYKEILFPITDILTPNANEVEIFTGIKINDMNDIVSAGERFEKMGIKSIIFKGGHIDSNQTIIIDYLYEDGAVEAFMREKIIGGENTHGTGCIFASLFAGFMADGNDIYDSMSLTELYLETDFRHLYYLPKIKNKDSTESNQLASPKEQKPVLDVGYTPAQRQAIQAVVEVVDHFCKKVAFKDFIPEVKTNISICIPGAKSLEDVAGVDGRITIVNNKPKPAGDVKLGVSNHTARLVLTAHAKDPEIRAAMNIKYIPELIPKLAEAGFFLFEIQREEQPNTIKGVENNTMQWVIDQGYKVINKMPDIIWDKGEPGKEPMIRLFAKDQYEMIEKLDVMLRVHLTKD